MMTNPRRLVRLFCFLLVLSALAWSTEPAKTIIQDVLYKADGTPASGTLVISWPAFVSAESVFGTRNGTDKKEAALNFVASALAITQAVAEKDVIDPEKFRAGLGQIIDGTVTCLNASAWSKTK